MSNAKADTTMSNESSGKSSTSRWSLDCVGRWEPELAKRYPEILVGSSLDDSRPHVVVVAMRVYCRIGTFCYFYIRVRTGALWEHT